MLTITVEELARLKNFSNDKGTLESLKKFFLEHAIRLKEKEIHTLAASRLTIDIMERAFIALEHIELPEQEERKKQVAL